MERLLSTQRNFLEDVWQAGRSRGGDPPLPRNAVSTGLASLTDGFLQVERSSSAEILQTEGE